MKQPSSSDARKHASGHSLSEVYATVETTGKKSLGKRLLAFLGPAYLVSVGYMDPGNWATDIAGGSQFGYKLIWVLLMSNLMALLLQSLSARLGIVRNRDLAQASREAYPGWINSFLYILAEIAIAATDLAEVLGMAIGLQLLFHLPLLAGVSLTVLDTFILLQLQNLGMRKMEAFILSLVTIVGLSFLMEMFFAQPDLGGIAGGLIPSALNNEALYIAIGIIGATVMPHNLYLHSALVQSRKIDKSREGIRSALRFNILDSTIALNLAFFVNAAILVLAAATFFRNGMYDVSEIQDAHQFLAPILGTKLAPILFAVALIAAGQSSTITGTLSGQIVMEGYLNLRIQPWLRRLITRALAIIPALLVIWLMGEKETGKMLIFSQVLLSLQLGFAVIPLIHFVSDKKKMGEFAIGRVTKIFSWLCALVIIGLNVKLVVDEITGWLTTYPQHSTLIWTTAVPVAALCACVLLYITLMPLLNKRKHAIRPPHVGLQKLSQEELPGFHRVAIAIDFSDADSKAIAHAIAQGGNMATYVLIHIVETAGAMVYGKEINDFETGADKENLTQYASALTAKGYRVETKLGFGNPRRKLPEIVNEQKVNLLVMGAHGHSWFKDLIFGTTVESVRHRVGVAVLIVK
ncbi:MAG: Nramp family divalent metal transporter [Flavobacteriales bacterium]|nr:Nramp family divalent metal transporter [Flavobacteriales bacterium]MCB9447203.1 Nramp family divalent metal transporter [Flavobacteriales bacterium]